MSDEGLLFEGLKVLDVGTWIAGPVAATILADFGASVIKVEQPGVGDPYRHLSGSPVTPHSDLNYMWMVDARNKRGITLNLATDEGHDVLMKLVRECDVYVTNQPLPARRKLRLLYEDLAPENERMIYASLTAYGEHGPDAEMEGFDGVAWWSRTGLMDEVRYQHSTPGMSVPGMGDHPTAVSLYAAIVTALLRRERTGKGGKVHTSLLANGLWANTCYVQGALVEADFSDHRAIRPLVSPNRVLFETSDKRLLQLYMVRTDELLDQLLISMGLEELLADERFGHDERPLHAVELTAKLQEVFATRTAAEWMAHFRADGVPVTQVMETREVLHDPQLRPNGIAVPPTDPRVRAKLVLNHPVNIDGLGRVGPRHAPEVGEHTSEVLAELGYSDADITAFAERGVT